MSHRYDVVVVGAGTTGAAAAYHLTQAGVSNILCLDMGTPGVGRTEARKSSQWHTTDAVRRRNLCSALQRVESLRRREEWTKNNQDDCYTSAL